MLYTIKPLEWIISEYQTGYTNTVGNTYWYDLFLYNKQYTATIKFINNDIVSIGSFPTLEAAKEACEKDNRERLKTALSEVKKPDERNIDNFGSLLRKDLK